MSDGIRIVLPFAIILGMIRFAGVSVETPACAQVEPPAKEEQAASVTRPAEDSKMRLTLKRWAVVADAEVQKAGLSDLVTAELSSHMGIELVERERMSEVVGELALAGCLGADGAGERLRLGSLLNADALVLLSIEKRGEQHVVRTIICDCGYGARLHAAEYPLAKDSVEELAEQCAGEVQAARRRFAGGVTAIVGVSHFVCKNLTHDFDHLQSAYATLFSDALAAHRGVAVLEIAEARSIARELARDKYGLANRAVPLFVEGEYSVTADKDGAERTVDLGLVVASGAQARQELRVAQQTDEQITAWLTRHVPQVLVEKLDRGAFVAISTRRQFDLLRARADRFNRLGAHKHAASLFEATLLLAPDDVELRMAAIRTIHAWGRESESSYPGATRDERCGHWFLDQIDIFQAGARHLERLVRNRSISLEQATKLCYAHNCLQADVRWNRPSWSQGPRFAVAYERERLAFLHEVMMRCNQLPSDGPRELVLRGWKSALLNAIPQSVFSTSYGKSRADVMILQTRFYDGLVRSLECDDAASQKAAAHVAFALAGSIYFGLPEAREEFHARTKGLAGSADPRLAVFGETGLLALQWNDARLRQLRGGEAPPQHLLADAIAIDKKYRLLGTFSPADRTPVHGVIAALRPEPPRPKQPHSITTRPSPLQRSRPAVKVNLDSFSPPASNKPPSLAFHEFYPIIRGRSGGVVDWKKHKWATRTGRGGTGRIIPILRCDDRMDVVLTNTSVLLHREFGVFDEIHHDPDAQFSDAAWDGTHIWIATLDDGILAFDADGKEAFRVGRRQGLPPGDVRLLLWPVAPGKVFAVGSFGEKNRGWCAIVERMDGNVEVDVFHEATDVVEPERVALEASRNARSTFVPRYVCEVTGLEPHLGRMLIVDRHSGSGDRRLDTSPLFVELNTLEVFTGVFPALYHASNSPPYFLQGGQFISCNGDLATIDIAAGRKQENLPADAATAERALRSSGSAQKRSLVGARRIEMGRTRIRPDRITGFRGHLYLPTNAHAWSRIETATLKLDIFGLQGKEADLNMLNIGCLDDSALGALMMRSTPAKIYYVSIDGVAYGPWQRGVASAESLSPEMRDRLRVIRTDMATNGNRFDRAELYRLGEWGLSAVCKRLFSGNPFLSEEDGSISRAAAFGLANNRHWEAMGAFVRGVDDPRLLNTLAHLVAEELADGLPADQKLELLEDTLVAIDRSQNEQPMQRLLAAFSMLDETSAVWLLRWGVRHECGARFVLEAMRDPRDAVARAAVGQSSPFRSRALREAYRAALIDAFERRDDDIRLQAAFYLMHDYLDPVAIRYLLAETQSSDPRRAIRAIRALGDTSNARTVAYPELRAALLPLLNSEDAAISRKAAAALSIYTGEAVASEVVPFLAIGLKYDRDQLRRNLLANQHREHLRQALRNAADSHDDSDVRRATAELLEQLEAETK